MSFGPSLLSSIFQSGILGLALADGGFSSAFSSLVGLKKA
jgi:hypothetical protein